MEFSILERAICQATKQSGKEGYLNFYNRRSGMTFFRVLPGWMDGVAVPQETDKMESDMGRMRNE